MNRGFELMSTKLDVKGRNINHIMQWYHEDALVVNRKYQRKLVWSLEEKRLFIDSLLRNFPTPSMIVSEYEAINKNNEKQEYYEIIDGLQRLNAIVSFVENEYGIIIDGEEYFYDMQFIPTALGKKVEGKLKQREPILDFNLCKNFYNVEVPVIITKQGDNRDYKIEQIFERINSSGRTLSAHDIRQAGSINSFADLVRRIATMVRGDYTYSDEVNLCDMPKISLSNTGLNYGVDIESTFWRRHDIIQDFNLRQSRDEEIIATILATILLGKDFKIYPDNLNSLYNTESKNAVKVISVIDKVGKEVIEEAIIDIINQIDNIFESVNSNFTKYLYNNSNAKSKDISFVVLVCTLYRLKAESYTIEDYKKLAETLKSQFNSIFGTLAKNSKHDNRNNTMDLLYTILQRVMVKQLKRKKTNDDKLLEKLLSLSSIESQMVEFKIGITFFENGKINKNDITRIWKTLVAMANTKCTTQQEGYVIIGVANNKQSYENWKRIYNESAVIFNKHRIVGITGEATANFTDEDKYESRLTELIRDSKISEPLKEYILSNYRMVNFKGKTLVLLPATKQDGLSYYDNKFYVREGTQTCHKEDKDL